MEGLLHTILWCGWAFACAFCARFGFARMFRPWLGAVASLAAYGMCFVLLLMGWAIISMSGFQMYGFDASDPRQQWGYWLFFYSPFGLPTVVGAPAVLVLDLVRVMLTWRKPRQTA